MSTPSSKEIQELAREIAAEYGVDANEAEMFARITLGLPNMECGTVSPMDELPGQPSDD